MPKEKKEKYRKAPSAAPADEDDNASVTSEHSGSTVPMSDEDAPTDLENYEAKVREAIDLALEKSVSTRTNALISLTTALQKRVLSSFLLENHQTFSDLVDRSIKKGRGAEQVAAAKLGNLLLLSLSAEPEAEAVYKVLHPVLTVAAMDPTAAVTGRAECCQTLALAAFLACHELPEIMNTMNTLHSIFAASLPKGNGELPVHPAPTVTMHVAALNGFCLLLCLLSPTAVYTMAPKLLQEMFYLLGSSDVDMRIQAGEAMALIYESARLHDEYFVWRSEKDLIAVLNDLATDSHKYRAKKDRKQQRASFRDVTKTVQESELPSETVSVGPQVCRQELILDTWTLKWQYHFLCHALGTGLSIHITYNIGVRDVFGLGEVPLQLDASMAALARRKQKRPNRETPACKARSLARTKNRDNRASSMTYDD